jgi:hypothetical protein
MQSQQSLFSVCSQQEALKGRYSENIRESLSRRHEYVIYQGVESIIRLKEEAKKAIMGKKSKKNYQQDFCSFLSFLLPLLIVSQS